MPKRIDAPTLALYWAEEFPDRKPTTMELAALDAGIQIGAKRVLTRAVALHEQAGMPWPQAEELALSEAGVDDAAIDELLGECGHGGDDSFVTGRADLRALARSILVHGVAQL